MKQYNPPETIFDITDEAFDMVNKRIDVLREIIDVKNHAGKYVAAEELEFLKDLRNLLRMQENFRDEEL